MTDIDDLLRYFVDKEIISIEQYQGILECSKTADKVHRVLIHISSPLQSGNVTNFYSMLEIMEEHGRKATQQLAEEFRLLLPHSHSVTAKGTICNK